MVHTETQNLKYYNNNVYLGLFPCNSKYLPSAKYVCSKGTAVWAWRETEKEINKIMNDLFYTRETVNVETQRQANLLYWHNSEQSSVNWTFFYLLDGGIINIQYLQWCCARSCLEFFCLLSLAMGTDGWRRWNNKLEVNNPKLVQANSNGLKKMSVLPKKVDIVYKMFWVANTCGSLCSVQTACWVFHLLLWLVGDW